MKNLTISLLLYKSEKYIPRLISCLMNQTDKNFEILIINNASPDNSVDLAIEILEKNNFHDYKVVKIDKNTGCGQGRVAGYRNATYDYVKFLDSDDLLIDTYVEKINKEILKNKPDLINYGHIVIDEDGNEIRRIPVVKNKTISKYTLTMFWRYCFRKELAIQQEIDTSGMHYAEDRIFSLNLIPAINNISILDDYLYKYTRRTNSTTQNVQPEVFFDSNKTVMELYKNLLCSTKEIESRNVLFYQIIKFYVTSLILPSKVNRVTFNSYLNMYEKIYFETINSNRYKKLLIIPKKGLNKETLVIQLAYLFLVFKQKWLFTLAFRRY